MSKNLFASEKVMEDYLSALLTEENHEQQPQEKPTLTIEKESKPKAVDTSLKPVAKLLAEASQKHHQQAIEQPSSDSVKPRSDNQAQVKVKSGISIADKISVQDEVAAKIADMPPIQTDIPDAYRTGDFQALYFKVAGLTVAVPLTELGGIHNIDKSSPLIGKPEWFKGVMLYREEKINLVDTARWVMPEKYDQALAEKLDYKYVIMLGESSWGLTCESLVNTLQMKQEDIKWLPKTNKRPWLAGLVKEKMCALLNVKELIALLNKGLSS